MCTIEGDELSPTQAHHERQGSYGPCPPRNQELCAARALSVGTSGSTDVVADINPVKFHVADNMGRHWEFQIVGRCEVGHNATGRSTLLHSYTNGNIGDADDCGRPPPDNCKPPRAAGSNWNSLHLVTHNDEHTSRKGAPQHTAVTSCNPLHLAATRST